MYLKELNFKKFSTPFDAMYLSSIINVIDILENKLQRQDCISTETIVDNPLIDKLHELHGYRTLHKKYDLIADTDIVHCWHRGFLPHHNFSKDTDWNILKDVLLEWTK